MGLSVRGLRLGAAAFVIGLVSTAAQAQSESSTYSIWPKWGPFLDIEGKVGTKRNLGEVNLFVPVWQNEQSMLFGDFRFKADDQNSHEGNFGLGFRKMLDGGWNAGAYGFYDHRRSPNANLFDQLTFGAELLGTNFDLRANTYWPIGNVQQAVGSPVTPTSTASVSGTALQVFTPATMQTYEFAMRGFDAEAGVRVPITPAESPYHLRFYAGGFRFDEPTGQAQIIAGPRLRLEFTDYQVPGLWNGTRFTVGGEWQTDDVRGSQFFAGLRLRVPLEAESRRSTFTLQERRMTDAIVRDVDIVANTQSIQVAPAITETATQTASGTTITGISSDTTSGANLATAVTNAGGSAFIVLQGTFNTGTTQIAMVGGQTIIGSGSVALRTVSGRTVTATLPGATISSTRSGSAIIQPTDNTTLTGLMITGTVTNASGLIGVQPNNTAGNITISNNTITLTNTGANTVNGIGLASNNNVTVSGNTVTVTGAAGQTAQALVISGGSTAIYGNSLSASGGTTNRAVSLSSTTVSSGSTGNVNAAGVCRTSGTITGSMSFTDGTTCP